MQLLNAQSDLSSQVQELRRDGGSEVLSAAEAQLSELSQVQQRLASGIINVAALRSEVTAIVAAATAVATEARVSRTSHAQHAEAALTMASAEARHTVDAFVTDFYEKKVFDPYLRFASAEDEAAYRERAEERQRAIQAAHAEGTPEGTSRATDLTIAQLDDAGAHGASDSPDFQTWRNRLGHSRTSLTAAMAKSSDGPPVSDPANNRDPLEDISPNPHVDPSILAALKISGVTVSDPSATGHGLNANAVPPGSPGRG